MDGFLTWLILIGTGPFISGLFFGLIWLLLVKPRLR